MRIFGLKKVQAAPAGSRRESRQAPSVTAKAAPTGGCGRSFVMRHSSFVRAFTLIEIMVVVAIMGIILAAGIPSLYSFFHKTGLRKTMSDIEETCKSARQKAIMSGTTADLVIHPREGTLEIAGGVQNGYSGWAKSAKIEGTRLIGLKVNNSHADLSQADEVHVRFYPTGTCDEMIMIFLSDNNESKGISLEITTALPVIMNDQEVKAMFFH